MFASRNEDFMLCQTDAQQFAFEILEQLGLVTKKQAFPKSQYGWTTEEERLWKKYIKEQNCFDEHGKVKFGTYTMLGEMLGKSREQVKHKIQHMRKEGKFEKWGNVYEASADH